MGWDAGFRGSLHQVDRWDGPEIIRLLALCGCHCANFKVEVIGHDDVDIHSMLFHKNFGGPDLGSNLMPAGLAP